MWMGFNWWKNFLPLVNNIESFPQSFYSDYFSTKFNNLFFFFLFYLYIFFYTFNSISNIFENLHPWHQNILNITNVQFCHSNYSLKAHHFFPNNNYTRCCLSPFSLVFFLWAKLFIFLFFFSKEIWSHSDIYRTDFWEFGVFFWLRFSK